MSNVDKLNINLNKNKIVKCNSLAIKANKKHKINKHGDVLNDNNNTGTIINMLKNNHDKNKYKVNDETKTDDELINRELFM